LKIDWKQKLRDLPAGLTYSEVASRIGVGYFTARSAMLKHHYDAPDGRWFSKRGSRKVKPDKVDWTMPNIAIAKAFKVSRERIRMIRKQLGKPFVESRGRKLKSPASKPKTKTKNARITKTRRNRIKTVEPQNRPRHETEGGGNSTITPSANPKRHRGNLLVAGRLAPDDSGS